MYVVDILPVKRFLLVDLHINVSHKSLMVKCNIMLFDTISFALRLSVDVRK